MTHASATATKILSNTRRRMRLKPEDAATFLRKVATPRSRRPPASLFGLMLKSSPMRAFIVQISCRT
jgi:hypothetical protein